MKQVSRLILLLVALFAGMPAWAATRQVTGTITDQQGEPLTGASVMLENSRTGCMADIDGNFSLQVPEGPVTLKIALIGYQSQTVKLAANQTSVKVVMKEDSQTLEETVVVGYGTQKKVNLTGAVAALQGESLQNRPTSNLSTMLQGSVAGLNVTTGSDPGSAATLNIRGTTSINSASPLVLVDGANGDINSVDPNDVASISIIKDASAAAIYGARAAFGVILITTKRGSETDGKATVRYNGRFGWIEPTTTTDYEHRGYWHLKTMNDFAVGSTGTPYFSQSYWNESDWAELLLRVNDETEHPDRPWTVESTDAKGKKIWKYYGNTDWYHEMFRDQRFTTQHNVSLSGGNKTVRYFVSGGLKHEDGISKFDSDSYNTYNLRSKVDFTINKWATFENNTSIFGSKYSFQGDGNMKNTIAYANQGGISVYPTQNPDGSNVYDNIYSTYKPTNGRYIVMKEGKHPGSNVKTDFQTMSRLNIMPIKQLTLTGDFTYRFLQNRNMTRSNNIPYRINPEDDMKYYATGMGQDDLKETTQTYQYYSVNALATYKDTFNDKHNLNVVAGYNWESRTYKQLQSYVMNLGVPDLNDVSLAPSLEGATITGGQNEYSIMGIFGRINYDYMGKYLVELSGRYDGTSRFAKGHRWGFFPSGSIGWRFSEEKFFEGLNPWWSNGKIRASYGSLGNQNVSSYYTFLRQVSVYTMNGSKSGDTTHPQYLFTPTTYAKYSTAGAPVASDMTWEKANQWDLGLDLGFFNNRLSATVDLYIRDTKGMLTNGMDLPAVYGATVPKMNAADLRTKGYELSLEWNDAFTLWNNKFTYFVGFNISDYTSKITKFKDNEKKVLSNYYEGQEFGEIWGYRLGGIFQSTEEAQEYASKIDLSNVTKRIVNGWQAGDLIFLDTNNDKRINNGDNTLDNHGDLVKLGNSLARLQYGFRAGFQYYGFDVNAVFQGTGNHYYYPEKSTGQFWGAFSAYYQVSFLMDDFDYWREDNPNAYFPRPSVYSASSGTLQFVNDRYIQNLRYLRFKNLTVGYTFPRKWTQKACIDKLRLYFTAENLCYWSPTKKHMKYIDPEVYDRSESSKFYNMAFYPWPKTFMFGIDLQF